MLANANTILDRLFDAPTLLALVNAGLGFAMCYLDFQYYNYTEEPWKWIKLAYAIIGLYWGCLYIYVVIVNVLGIAIIDPITFGRIFVRPAFTVTLGVMLAGAIIRHRKPK